MANVSVKIEMEEEYETTSTAAAEVFYTEEDEEWCFVCKDGGDLILCDHENCPKAYHRHCAVKIRPSLNNVEEHFECAWHSCFNCKNPSIFRCYICPKSICNICMDPECFLLFKGIYGFCDKCRKFALAIQSIDFEDLSTRQLHFKEYYEILEKRESFNLISLLSLKKSPILKNNDHDKSALLKKNGDVVEDKVFVKLPKRKINYIDLSDDDEDNDEHDDHNDNDDDGVPETRYAAIIDENIKLIYLTKSLVLDLLKQPESFESKVQGAFVRVESKLVVNGDCQSKSHQLVQVVGVKKEDDLSGTVDVKLQLHNVHCDVSIDLLSDVKFSEIECEILRQNVESGLLKKPTFEEFEQKAKALHHDLTKDTIERELNRLKHAIDRANEKGMRLKKIEYLERKERLETDSEVKMMLNTPPKVIAADVSKVVINTVMDEDKKRKKNRNLPKKNRHSSIDLGDDCKIKKNRSILKPCHSSIDLEDAYKIKKSRILQKHHQGSSSINPEDGYKIEDSFEDTLKCDKGCVLEDDVIREGDKTTSEMISPKNSISSFDDEALGRTLGGLIKPTDVSKHSVVSVPSKAIDHFQKGFILALKEIPISNYKELMIPFANGFFTTLQTLNIDYTQLYTQVKDYIRTSARLAQIDLSEKSPSVQELTIMYESRKSSYEKSYKAFNKISKSLNVDLELSANRSEHVSRLSNMVEMSVEMEMLKKEMFQALDELDKRRNKWLEEEKAKEDFMKAKAAL